MPAAACSNSRFALSFYEKKDLLPHVASASVQRGVRGANAAPPDPLADLIKLRRPKPPKRLTARGAFALEARLRRNPDDRETRLQLVEYYLGLYDPKVRGRLLEHLTWIYQHYFEEDLSDAPLSYLPLFYTDAEYARLRDIILKQVELHRNNPLSLKAARVLRSVGESRVHPYRAPKLRESL